MIRYLIQILDVIWLLQADSLMNLFWSDIRHDYDLVTTQALAFSMFRVLIIRSISPYFYVTIQSQIFHFLCLFIDFVLKRLTHFQQIFFLIFLLQLSVLKQRENLLLTVFYSFLYRFYLKV